MFQSSPSPDPPRDPDTGPETGTDKGEAPESLADLCVRGGHHLEGRDVLCFSSAPATRWPPLPAPSSDVVETGTAATTDQPM
ncbi:hypothetical protein FKM82_030262 [Ascaphus truei]